MSNYVAVDIGGTQIRILTTAALGDEAGLMGALAIARSLALESPLSQILPGQNITHA